MEPPMFDLMVLYEWKPGTTPQRVEHHFRKIRALAGKVPGLSAIRVGPKTMGHGPGVEAYTHGCVMTFDSQDDYNRFGRSPEHDGIAPELVADLQNIFFLGFPATASP
jgi:hypothetical protein